mgnify:FL=1|jgi:hypothetical protein|tara:strand:+ start:401 stop:616 length:216 start_codon:yes stop_codon:yes gene_type:complete
MINFKRIHYLAGSVALVCLIWQFPKCHEEIIEDWQLGIRFTAGVAIGAYLLGYIAGLVVNFTLLLFHKDDK